MIDRYDIDDAPIASGSQGAVHFALRDDGLPVAIKIAGAGRHAAEALRREIHVLRALGAAGVDGVVPCLDAIEVDGRPALVMPRYPRHLGAWLQEVLAAPGPDTLADVLGKIAGLARVLGRVHATRIDAAILVHRDVKPENILLDDHGAPWLADFGGAMAVEGLEAVELALFGTPMWAPLDQILPGRAIPDPTWDTYALCVLLYAAISGARPAYQSDPRTLLTDDGAALWEAARRAIEAPPHDRARWHKRFADVRKGTRAADLIDPTGHAALVDADREVLDAGLGRLCALAHVPDQRREALRRGLWNLLNRGLSPLSHPSPPNRYRSGVELADTLDELRALLDPPARGLTELELSELSDPRPRAVAEGPNWLAIAGVGAVLAAGLAAAWVWRAPALEAVVALGASVLPRPETVVVPPSDGAPALRLDTTEVTVARYKACARDGACPPIFQRYDGEWPAVGLDLAAARAFCAWAGGRLPTEAEWRRAIGNGPLPWGDGPVTCDRAVALGCGELAPVGSAPLGASPVGALDLAGNAWEWVEEGVLLGGAVDSPASDLGGAARLAPPGGVHPLAGVRCAWPHP